MGRNEKQERYKRVGEAHLDLSEVFRPLGHIHPLQANTNGARGDDDDSVSISPQFDRGFNDQG